MSDPDPRPTADTDDAPGGGSPPGISRWQVVVGSIGLLVVVLLVGRALFGVDHGPGMHGGAGAAGQDPVEGAEDVTVVAAEMTFEPGALELVAGEPVNLTLVNGGEVEHDWDLDEAGAHLHAEPGQEVTQAVVVDEPGTYEAICTMPGHADAGMRMTVEVRPADTSPADGFDHSDLEDLDPDERREFFEELHG